MEQDKLFHGMPTSDGYYTTLNEDEVSRPEGNYCHHNVNGCCDCCKDSSQPLNVTENGVYIADAGSSYNPVIVDVEGGIDSGDYSIAHVTVINNLDATMFIALPFLDRDTSLSAYHFMAGLATYEFDVVLYKGVATGCALNPMAYVITCDGDISLDEISRGASILSGRPFTITGDGTITLDASPQV